MVLNFNELRKHKAYFYLFGLVMFQFLAAYPGVMTSDSISQYSTAKSGIYSDHHPALMAFVWRHLDMVVEGSGLMLLLHFSLMLAGLFYGIRTFKDSALKYFFVLFPIIPQIAVYSFMIWKDVGFAFSFLLCSMMLANSFFEGRKLKLLEHIVFWFVLIYGSSVKFQAQYCAPVLIFFYIYSQTDFIKNTYSKFGMLIAVGAGFYSALFLINASLVEAKSQNHSWQFVKLYDLAAIGVDTGNVMVPEKFRTQYYSYDQLLKRFNNQSVDDMIFGSDPIFVIGKDENERKELWNVWFQSIKKYPLSYLNHRLKNLNYSLTLFPGHKQVEVLISRFFEFLNIHSKSYFEQDLFSEDGNLFKIVNLCVKSVLFLLVGNSIVVFISFIYIFLSIFELRHKEAKILLMLNLVAVFMVLALFFFSMAGTSRYTYIVMCMVHASHAFVGNFVLKRYS